MPTDVIGGEVEEDEVVEEIDLEESDPEKFFERGNSRLVYQTNNFFLPQIRQLINDKEILTLRPAYQRRLRWNPRQKSTLIESFLLNIPVPPIFLYENEAARYEVMDGQQRLNSVHEFMENEFALSGLPALKFLNGKRYADCSPRIKRTLARASLSAIVLLLESKNAETASRSLRQTDVRRLTFNRLNTGGTKLNRQEIRNALYPGVLNDILIDITRWELFTKVFDIPAYEDPQLDEYYEDPKRQENNTYATMLDCQLALRYFALKDEPKIRGAMQSMLDRTMEVEISKTAGEIWKREYYERFTFLYDLFDAHPFRLPPDDKGRRRLSAAIYDASMVAINSLWDSRNEIEADKANVQDRMAKTMKSEDKLAILTGQKNTANAVRERINLMRQILRPQ